MTAIMLAKEQYGAICRRQWLAAGVSDKMIARLVRGGDARRMARGVVALEEPSWMQDVAAGWLLGGEDAVIGGLAATLLTGLQMPPGPPVIDVYAPQSRLPRQGPWRFIRASRSGIGWPPSTTMEQTLVDLAGTIPDTELLALIAEADFKLNTEQVIDLLAQGSRRRGRAQLGALIADFESGVRSPLELKYAQLVERPHRLPTPLRQGKPLGAHPSDILYDDFRVIIELDGRQWHEGLVATRDAALDTQHLLAGFVTMRFGWADVTQSPCRVARQVAEILASRGWGGSLARCKKCR